MATTDTVPSRFDVGIDGTGYMIDTQYLEAYRSRTLDPIRRQADSSSSVGESSLNPEGYWRRSPESWHKGSDQARYDGSDSDPERFDTTYGVDVWTEGQLSMLPDVDVVGTLTVSGSITHCIEASGALYTLDSGGTIRHTTYTTSALTPVGSSTGPVGAVTHLTYAASAGRFFIIDTGSLYSATSATGTYSLWISGDPTCTDVFALEDRVFVISGGELYDVSASGLASLPTSLGDVNVSSGMACTYTSGYFYFVTTSATSRNSVIKKTTINSAGTGLELLTTAATLPRGELIEGLYGLLGFVLLGTAVPSESRTMRAAVVGADGDLTVGSAFATRCNLGFGYRTTNAASYGQYVYTPASDVNATSYRFDLSVINDALELAWAQDVDFSDYPRAMWVDSGGKIYALMADGDVEVHSDDFVTTGYVEMGEVSFGTRENKLFLDPVETVTDGTVSHVLTTPDGTAYGNQDVPDPVPAVTWRMALTPTTATSDMTLQYPILRALPAPTPIDETTVPLLLHRRVENRQGAWETFDPAAELTALRALRSGGLVDFQEGSVTRSAQVIGVDWLASDRDLDGSAWDGTALVRLKVVA